MKYMGSKAAMLLNGLGETLAREIGPSRRFVDLFSGSAAVAIHVARKYDVEVVACDLQHYSKVLAGAVLEREIAYAASEIWDDWSRKALECKSSVRGIPSAEKISVAKIGELRDWCSAKTDLPITAAYGGHYFSPTQAVWIDALRATVPRSAPKRTLALAALIRAASQSVAAPGHTAQPFQPTRGSKKYLQDAWNRSVVDSTKRALTHLSSMHAKKMGSTLIADANVIANTVRKTDLVFIDPPYSGVHYSRFYHVLESISRGYVGKVSGIGRYPERRPKSLYSRKADAEDALNDLLFSLASRRARAVLTFPDHECSNGLSGDEVREICGDHFRVKEKIVESRFSTLGGTVSEMEENGRGGRHYRDEMILVLTPH